MRNFIKRNGIGSITVSLIVLGAISSQLLIPLKANAFLGIGDTGVQYVVGGPVTVTDPTHTAATTGGWIAEAARFTLDNALKVALQALKMRLLNAMTDQIVTWINNGFNKPPLFTTDFWSVFRDARDKAVGDVLQQYSLTKPLCQPFSFDITLQLQQPAPLAQQVTCSLQTIIGNFNAYRQDFKNGSWLAYNELLKPQNNQWGVEIITQNQIMNETAQNTNANVLQQQVNVGFNSEECTGGWDLIDQRTNQPPKSSSGANYVSHIPPDKARAPNDPPPSPGGDPNLVYRCTSATVTTPGRTIATGLEKATYGTFDAILTSQDLTNSLAIIADAAFNKLIKAGVNGIKGVIAQSDAANQASVQQAQNDYQNTSNQVTSNTRNAYISQQLNPAANSLTSALSVLNTASSTNQQVSVAANQLLACSGATADDKTAAQAAIDNVNPNYQIISNKKNQINSASSTISQIITNISASSCDSLCLSQAGQQVNAASNTASSLSVDANNILLAIQSALNDVQNRKTTACK